MYLIPAISMTLFASNLINPQFPATLENTEGCISGKVYYGRNNYIEYFAGNLPIIISVPHGGGLEPSEIPNRKSGSTLRDPYTMELSYDIREAIYEHTGRYPHLIISCLRRTKMDPNREVNEAAQGNEYAIQAWNEFHDFIELASNTVIAQFGKGLYIDLHAHGHPFARFELGYLLSSHVLRKSDVYINGKGFLNKSSIRALVGTSGVSLAELIRGSNSLGAIFSKHGIPAVPSPEYPDPGGKPYFNGGYNTLKYGSKYSGNISGIQIETHARGIRDTESNRKITAGIFALVIDEYFKAHFFDLI